MKSIGFYHSAFADRYEKQANDQGYTLGDKAEEFDKISFSYNMLRIHGFFNEKQEENICQKIQKRLVANLKPLHAEEGEQHG